MTALELIFAVTCAGLLALGYRTWRRARFVTQGLKAVANGDRRFVVLPRRHFLLSQIELQIQSLVDRFERELAEARREQGWFRTTLQALQEGVLVLDERGIVLMSNPAVARILQSSEPIEGRPLVELWREPTLWSLVRNAAASNQPVEQEVFLPGQSLYLRASVTPVRSGQDYRTLVVLRDVTTERRLEQVRRDFVANVSHELRTPLTAIRGYAETLLEGALEQPQVARRFLEVIDRHARRLARLSEDLLTLSNLELGRVTVRAAAVEPEIAIQHALEAVARSAQEKRVSIEVDCPSGSRRVWTDPDRLQQILVNLLDNAIKYSPSGTTVTVRTREVAQAVGTHVRAPQERGEWMEFTVEDQGEGIPSRDLPRIGERFYRVDAARSRASGGTGLGLAIVKHLVELLGGALRIDSVVGQGTSVRIYLPSVPAR